MKRYNQFLAFWLVNSVILFLATLFLPGMITAGNNIFEPYQAIVFSGFVWSAVLWHVESMAKDLEIPIKDKTTMMLTYLAVNFATVWFIARFSFISGMGIASFWYVLLLAAVGNFAQYATWRYTNKKK